MKGIMGNIYNKSKHLTIVAVMAALLFALSLTNVFANGGPLYMAPPEGAQSQTNQLSGTGGTAGLTAWYWYDVDSGYDYFAYQLLNNDPYSFSPNIAWLSIDYPIAKEYTVTGSASSSRGGDPWSPGIGSANVSWSATGYAAPIFPGDTSTVPYFEFAVSHTVDNWYTNVAANIVGTTGPSGDGSTVGPAIPEPGTLMLLGTGLSLLAGYRIRKRGKKA